MIKISKKHIFHGLKTEAKVSGSWVEHEGFFVR